MAGWLSSVRPQPHAAPKYSMQVAPAAPWAAGLHAVLGDTLGRDALGRQTVRLLASSRQSSTYKTYQSAFTRWCLFLQEQNIDSLRKTSEATVCRYIAWLGSQGTVAATSLQPYLSAINRVYQDWGLPPIATGRLVSDTVAGLERAQHALSPPVPRCPFPPEHVVTFMQHAVSLCAVAVGTCKQLRLLRALLASCVSYLFFNRAQSTHSLSGAGLLVDPPETVGACIRLRARQVKGHSHKHLVQREIRIPVAAHPELAACLRTFIARRPPTDFFWALPGDRHPKTWSSQTQTAWLLEALQACTISPPPEVSWTSHSLRMGPATAAHAVGVSLAVIRYFGGWAMASDVVYDYIDPSALRTPAADALFGWLVQHLPTLEAAAAYASADGAPSAPPSARPAAL